MAVSAGALAVTLAMLRVRPDWTRGVIGGEDAWQNLWNLVHVDRALRTGGPMFFSSEVWAPEGAGLWAHTLSPTNTVPGALLSRGIGFTAAYNVLVVFAFVLAAVATYRLSRRLGMGVPGSALAGFVFAFAPQHAVRAAGHLNLLGSGWIPLALEGLVVAARAEGWRAWVASAGAGAALVFLVFSDWYLALAGALAAVCFSLFETARAAPERRVVVLARMAFAGALAAAATAPAGLALAREAKGGSALGHDPLQCSCAITSLVIPGRAQEAARVTRPLTERNTQTGVEGAAYLGIVPLLATLWTATGRRRVRALDPALTAGFLALVLSLGPKPRFFDTIVALPLPYWFLEKLFPSLMLGGCMNRLEALAFLPLALGTAAAAGRLLASGTWRERTAVTCGAAFLACEYAIVDPGVSVFPYEPPDPAMVAVAASPVRGNVLDVGPGVGALIRQLRHGRPQTFGYLSKAPLTQKHARLEDPLVGPLLDDSIRPLGIPPAAAAAALRHRWGVAFVMTSDASPNRERAARLGFPLFARTPGLSIVYALPEERLAPAGSIRFEDRGRADLSRGIFSWSFFRPETLNIAGVRRTGRWTAPSALLLAPLAPGRYELSVGALRLDTPLLVVSWGAGRRAEAPVAGVTSVPLDVRPEDVATDGTVLFHLETVPYEAPDGRALGVFVLALEPRT